MRMSQVDENNGFKIRGKLTKNPNEEAGAQGVSLSSADERRGRRGGPSRAGANDVLCYMDQGSFVGLRALGRGPVLQLTWLYPHALDEAAVRQFSEGLASGLLGRLLQRSPLPWGRHRWVANPVPGPVTWFRDPLPDACLPRLRRLLLDLPVDPEHGPGWRLAVQALKGGGCALTMLVSHTIADMQAATQAIADAVAGRRLDHGLPAPSRRWSGVMLARDSIESLRALPDVWRALFALVRRSRKGGAGLSRSSFRARSSHGHLEPAVEVPLVQVIMDAGTCQQRASDLGVSSNTLIMAFVARLAFRMDRMDAAGRVKLVLPVSDRHPGDRRGNALRSIAVMADPDACRNDPRALQRDFMAALASLFRHGDDVSPLFPLIPYVPLWLARHLEREALGADLPVGCSLIGELPPEMNRPCGEALLLQSSLLERYTAPELERLGGVLFIGCYRLGERLFLTVSGYVPDRATTGAGLAPLVRDALADMGLGGSVS
jgi:diacylglycerol O-acyltransferase